MDNRAVFYNLFGIYFNSRRYGGLGRWAFNSNGKICDKKLCADRRRICFRRLFDDFGKQLFDQKRGRRRGAVFAVFERDFTYRAFGNFHLVTQIYGGHNTADR